ncbi:MAG TPA: hypothetical protein DDX19_00150 [Rhodopirellula baltica]|nr:hypothetical protein [Rhodopirellula baltica]
MAEGREPSGDAPGGLRHAAKSICRDAELID